MENICIICLQDTQNFVIGKSCECQYCYNCVFDWFEQNPQMLTSQCFNCLNYMCKDVHSVEDFLSKIDEQKILDRYQDITFKNYLIKCQDIRGCPNKNCKSYGYLPQGRCKEFLQCEICNYKWYDKKCLSIHKIISLFLKNSKNNFLCFFQEFYYTHQCPNCEVSIIKNGGCNHMTCKTCNHEYCFICKEKHSGHDGKLCNLKENSFHFMLAYVIVQLLFTCGIHTFFIFIGKSLFCLACLIFNYILDINYKLIVIGALCVILDTNYHYQNYKKEKRKSYISPNCQKKKLFQALELVSLIILETIIILTTSYEDKINSIDSFAIYVIYPIEFLLLLFISLWYK
ncbi:unnamed protein product [Paramecium sonneborni]|uniref:RING-type domain-containing protein n=1 Tax=Paramecium sonneborni TaxID=65129 RepID=A0A8S1MRU5_9CILI|nr:unnamed protein product [Paramecium sonneborni]